MKKTCSILFLLALSVSLLSSCGETAQNPGDTSPSVSAADTTEAVTEAVTERLYPDTESMDFGGDTFRVLYFGAGPDDGYSKGFYFDLNADAETGDILLDDLYQRNQTAGELADFQLEFVSTKNESAFKKAVTQAVTAGTDDYDLIVPILHTYPTLLSSGYVYDLNSMEDLDLTMPWFDGISSEELTVGGKLYGVVSDWTIADKMSTICVFFSKGLAADLDLEDPYRVVLDGRWTLDYMTENARLAKNDLDGNGEMTLTDRFGILCDADFGYEIYHAGGMKIAKKDSDGITLSLFGDRELGALQKIRDIMNEEYFLNRKVKNLSMADMANLFASNQVLYFQHIPEALLELRSATNDFGIIPVPKYDETQESYISPITHYAATCTCIPMTAKDPEASAEVLNLLAAESHYTLIPDLYDVVLDVKYTRDSESGQMLDLIFNSRTYDIGNICNFGSLGDYILSLYTKTAIASDLEAKRSAALTAIDKLLETVQ